MRPADIADEDVCVTAHGFSVPPVTVTKVLETMSVADLRKLTA
jgi:hypothetical protein